MAESKPSPFLVFLGSVVCTITVCLPSWACGDFKLMKVCFGPFWTCENLQGKCSVNSENIGPDHMYDPEIAFKRAFAHGSVIIYFFASPALLATVILISRARSCLPCLAILSFLVGIFGLLVFVVWCKDYFQDQLQPSLASWLLSWVVTFSFQPAFYFFGAGSALLLLVALDSCYGDQPQERPRKRHKDHSKASRTRTGFPQDRWIPPDQGFPQDQRFPQDRWYPQDQGFPQDQRFPQDRWYPQDQGFPQDNHEQESEDEDYYRAFRETPRTPPTPPTPPNSVEAMHRADLTVARDRQNPAAAATPTEHGHFICPDCQRPCRSKLGLRSHMRVHAT